MLSCSDKLALKPQWCDARSLSFTPRSISVQVRGWVAWGEKEVLLQSLKDTGWQTPQGRDITLCVGRGAQPGERVMGISQSWPGSFPGLFWSGLTDQKVTGPCMTSDEGAWVQSPVCPARTGGDTEQRGCCSPHFGATEFDFRNGPQ